MSLHRMNDLKEGEQLSRLPFCDMLYDREGSTVLHDYALNQEKLSELLERIQGNAPELVSL